jgi:hypothetical protein
MRSTHLLDHHLSPTAQRPAHNLTSHNLTRISGYGTKHDSRD